MAEPWCVAQLDDTRVGLGTFVALKGACGKTTTTTNSTLRLKLLLAVQSSNLLDVIPLL